jgi:uncharacterized membrane protein YccC
LLVPVGWKVGELRVVDVAIGCLVSVLVGVLFWPRGVSTLVGDDLSDAYRTGAAYLGEAISWVRGHRPGAPTGARPALTAAVRLEDAVRSFLAEQGTKLLSREELWRLIGGALRLRLTAHALAAMPRACARVEPEGVEDVEACADALIAWYLQLAIEVGKPRHHMSPLAKLDLDSNGQSVESPGHASSRGVIWLREPLDQLAEHTQDLITPAKHVAETRLQPWWR